MTRPLQPPQRRGPSRPTQACLPLKEAIESDGAETAGRTLVTKKLVPLQRGTARWLRRFGPALLCVRYRLDPRTGMRYTTVELVVEKRETSLDSHAQVLLPIDFEDQALRRQAIDLGAKWKRREQAWLMTVATAIQLGLLRRDGKK